MPYFGYPCEGMCLASAHPNNQLLVQSSTDSTTFDEVRGTIGAMDDDAEVDPVALAVGDFDGDGDSDVLVGYTQAAGGEMALQGAAPADDFPDAVFLSVGNSGTRLEGNSGAEGSFEKVDDQSPSRNTIAAAVGDWNEDGLDDVVACTLHLDCSFLKSDGTGRFASTDLGSGISAKAGDFDRDSHLDVVLSSGVVWLGDGAGSFSQGSTISGGALEVADFDGDGVLDVVNSNRVFLGTGAGFIEGPSIASLYPGSGVVAATAVADFDHDSRPDIVFVVTESHSGPSVVLLNTGTGFVSANVCASNDECSGHGGVVGDLNHDSWHASLRLQQLSLVDITCPAVCRSDLFIITSDGPNLVFMNNGAGGFDKLISASGAAVTDVADTTAVAVLDANGDGVVSQLPSLWRHGRRVLTLLLARMTC
eukprot:COSAG04_NODE_1496_length_6528_cov_6.474568_5_plen_421_part_00